MSIFDKIRIPSLIKQLTAREPAARNKAESELVKIGEAAVEPLIAALQSGETKTGQAAAMVLGKIGGQQALESLIKALNGNDVFLAAGAAVGLHHMKNESSIEPLFQALQRKYDQVMTPYIHAEAALALAEFKDPRIFDILCSMLNGSSSVERENAAQALGILGDVRAVDPLFQVLTNQGRIDYERCRAATALGKLKDMRVRETLYNMSQPDSHVVPALRIAAAEALKELMAST